MSVRKTHNLLTTGEVATAIGVVPATVAKWHRRGLLSGYRLPGKGERRFRREDVVFFCVKHGLPLLLDGPDVALPGVLLAATQDRRLMAALEAIPRTLVRQATGIADLGYQVARLLPGRILIDLTITSSFEAVEAAACLQRRMPAMAIVLVLNEDDPGEGYPDHLRLLRRPFGEDAARAAVLRV